MSTSPGASMVRPLRQISALASSLAFLAFSRSSHTAAAIAHTAKTAEEKNRIFFRSAPKPHGHRCRHAVSGEAGRRRQLPNGKQEYLGPEYRREDKRAAFRGGGMADSDREQLRHMKRHGDEDGEEDCEFQLSTPVFGHMRR
jgi:hypothetical protein